MRDELGTTIELAFTRITASPISETVHVSQASTEGLIGSGSGEFETPIRKVHEFSAVLRPDKAFSIAMVILNNLAQLDEGQRARYNLPKIESHPFETSNATPERNTSPKN